MNGSAENQAVGIQILLLSTSREFLGWVCQVDTKGTMQRRHSASISGRHQDNAHPPKQVQ